MLVCVVTDVTSICGDSELTSTTAVSAPTESTRSMRGSCPTSSTRPSRFSSEKPLAFTSIKYAPGGRLEKW